MSDFHRASPEMTWPCLCRITNDSTETEICYKFKRRVAFAVELSIFHVRRPTSGESSFKKQVAQRATIAHLRTSKYLK